MSLGTWSARRLLAIWAGGLALQAVLILVPVILTRRFVERNGAQLMREAREADERWRVGDLADSLSLARQRATARASGSYTVTSQGDTLFALVHVPSGRPDSARVAAAVQRTTRTAWYLKIAFLWAIPAVLLLLTAAWLFVRHVGDAQERMESSP
jgi:hypothetical protein